MFLLFGLLACLRKPVLSDVPEAAEDGAPAGFSPAARILGLRDVSCAEGSCLALTGDALWRVPVGGKEPDPTPLWLPPGAWDTVGHEAGGMTLAGPCPVGAGEGRCAARQRPDGSGWDVKPAPLTMPPLQTEAPPAREEARAVAEAHARARQGGGRIPFLRSFVDPAGGLVRFVRGLGGGQLVRTGAPGVRVAGTPEGARVRPSSVRVPMPEVPASWPAWLLLHPSGQEAYLLAWPSRTLLAFDPVTLATRWRFPLEDAGHGLFLDGSGRWLLLAEGPSDAERLEDWPVPDPASPGDATQDEVLRALPQPPSSAVVVIDLARGEQALRLPGAHRRWSLLPDGRVMLATTEALGFHTPLPIPEPSKEDSP